MNHKAIVCKLVNLKPHPNGDKLQIGEAAGHTVIVGLENKEEDIGLFFSTELQLSEEYCKAHDLIRRRNPETGKTEGGFFEENRRVRALTLRGVKCEGYWAPITTLSFADSKYEYYGKNLHCPPYLGDEIDFVNGVKICSKYYTPATAERIKKQKESQEKEVKEGFASPKGETFACLKHFDTPNVKSIIFPDKPGYVILTHKLHGTSGRTAYGKVTRRLTEDELPLWNKILLKLDKWTKGKFKFTRFTWPTVQEWKYVTGTRNTIVRDGQGSSENEMRLALVKPILPGLVKGECIYYEIVGYKNNGQPLMKHSTTKSENKALKAKYGDQIVYSYGCSPTGLKPGLKTSDSDASLMSNIYVYRITRTTEDGQVLDMPWSQLKARCHELGVEHVPEADISMWTSSVGETMYIYKRNECKLLELFAENHPWEDEHISEGLCIRVEYNDSTRPHIYKFKTWDFRVLEGIAKDIPEYIDEEEIS